MEHQRESQFTISKLGLSELFKQQHTVSSFSFKFRYNLQMAKFMDPKCRTEKNAALNISFLSYKNDKYTFKNPQVITCSTS